MGLSRRQFTKEFKLAAVRWFEQGVSIDEAARALEVNPNCCIAGVESFARARATSFRVMGSRAGRRVGSRNSSARSVSKPWQSIF